MGRLNYRYQKRDSTPATAASSAPVILFEKNVLTCVTFLLFIGLAIWLVAVATDFWIVPVVLLSGSLNGGLEIEAQNRTFLWSHSGMWRRCDYYRTASATPATGVPSSTSELVEEEDDDIQVECMTHNFSGGSSNGLKTEMGFLIIVLLLSCISVGFSIYSICHPRYTYRRVAGCLHLLTASMLLVIIKFVESEYHICTYHEEYYLDGKCEASSQSEIDLGLWEGPKLKDGVLVYKGYSYLLAWITFIISILASISFFTWSKKRKHLSHDMDTQLH